MPEDAGSRTNHGAQQADDEAVSLTRTELEELIQTEAREIARKEARQTRLFLGSVIVGLFGFVVLGQSIEAGGSLTAVLVGVGALLIVAAGIGVATLFGRG